MKALEAKKLLEQIPEDDFLLNSFSNDKNKCCAVGHLVRLTSDDPENYELNNCYGFSDRAETSSIYTLAYVNAPRVFDGRNLGHINNGKTGEKKVYDLEKQSSKARVLAALDIMIEAGY